MNNSSLVLSINSEAFQPEIVYKIPPWNRIKMHNSNIAVNNFESQLWR